MFDRRQKMFDRRPKAVPQKRNLDQNINDSKSHICNFYLKILFRANNFIPHVLVDIMRFFYIPEFIAENLKPNKNQRKRLPILQYILAQKTSLILRISTLVELKIICSQNTAKNFLSLQIFQQTCFCLMSEKTFALHHFLTPKNYFLETL